MNKVLAIYDGSVRTLLHVVYALMILVMFMQVVLRYIFNAPLMWPEELSRLLFLWLVYGAAPLAISRKSHLAVDFFISRLSWRSKQKLRLSLYVFIITFLLVAVVKGFELTFTFMEESAYTMSFLPLGLFYLPIALGSVMMVVNLVRTIPEIVGEIKRPAMGDEVDGG